MILLALLFCGCDKSEGEARNVMRQRPPAELANTQAKLSKVRAEIAAISNRIREMQPGGAREIESDNLRRAESDMDELQTALRKFRH